MRILFFFFLLLSNYWAIGQTEYFSLTIDEDNYWSSARDVVETDSFYFMVGATGSPWTADTGHLFKLNKFTLEHETFSYNYFENGFLRFIEKRETSFGESLIIGGRYFNGDYINENVELYMIELEVNTLDTIQYKIFDLPDRGDWPLRMIQTSDGGFAIIGYSFSNNDINVFQSMFVLKCDSLWNQEFFKQYYHTFQQNHYANGITETPDKGFIIVGNVNKSNGTSDALILKIDSTGLIEYWKDFPPIDNEKNNYLVDVQQKENGNYIAVGNKTFIPFGLAQRQKYWVMEFDPQGNEVWSKEYFTHRFASWRSINLLPDGNYVVGGYERENGTIMNDTLFAPQLGTITKLSPDGDLIWYRRYMNNPVLLHYDFLWNAIPTTDNGILAVGTTWGDTLTRQDVWVLKLDSLGCLEEGCDPIINSVEEEVFEEVLVEVFPNPFEERVTFRWKANAGLNIRRIEVFDILGRQIWEKEVLGLSEIFWNTNLLQKGNYFYRVFDSKNEVVGSGKLIKY